MTRQEFLSELRAREIQFTNTFSHIYGSDYYIFENNHRVRVSDHSKNKNSLGYDLYELGVNDFRSYQELFEKLNNFCNVNYKNDKEKFYAEKERELIEIKNADGTIYYKNPFGVFVSKESALNNWFRKLNNN